MSTAQTRRRPVGKSRLIKGIARVDLRVVDVEEALTFYRDVAGLDVKTQDSASASLGSPGGEPFLTLTSVGVTEPADPGATGLFHTAFRYPTRGALGDALARLMDANYDVGAGDHLVSEALYIDDPSGNGVELYRDRPVEEWPPPTGDMMIPMTTVPVDMHGVYTSGTGKAAIGRPAPAGTDVGHVHFQIADVDETTAFYTEVLGLDLIARMGASAGFYSSYGYHHNIGGNVWRSRGAEPADRSRAGLDRVVFAVEDAGELAALRGRLSERGLLDRQGAELVVTDPSGIEMRFLLAA